VAFRGFTGYSTKKPTNQSSASQPKRVGFSDVGNRGSYTPGGDSFKNYSQKDQAAMFRQAGGKNKFVDQVANIEQNYNRPADIQKFLNRIQNRGNISTQSPTVTAQAPTFGQLFGDMGRGIGSIFSGIAQKGTPLMQLGKGIFGGISNFFSNTFNPGDIGGQLRAAGPEAQQKYTQFMQQPGMTYQKAFEMATGTPFTNPQGQTSNVISDFFAPKIDSAMGAVNDFIQSGQNFNTLLMGLRPDQRRVYDLEIMKPGMTREQAFQTAIRVKQMAVGGVASL